MILGELNDGASRLLLVLCLPLADGVFATLLVSGALDGFISLFSIALTIFSGAGSLAVLYSHSEDFSDAKLMIGQVAPFLILGSVIVGLIAPVFESLLDLSMMKTTAGIAILSIASQMAGLELANKVSVPGVLVTGAALSFRGVPSFSLSFEYVLPAFLTSSLACAILLVAGYFTGKDLELSYIRMGGAAVLAGISMSLFGLPFPTEASLPILALSVFASARLHDLNLKSVAF